VIAAAVDSGRWTLRALANDGAVVVVPRTFLDGASVCNPAVLNYVRVEMFVPDAAYVELIDAMRRPRDDSN